jgi:hypothetical protein
MLTLRLFGMRTSNWGADLECDDLDAAVETTGRGTGAASSCMGEPDLGAVCSATRAASFCASSVAVHRSNVSLALERAAPTSALSSSTRPNCLPRPRPATRRSWFGQSRDGLYGVLTHHRFPPVYHPHLLLFLQLFLVVRHTLCDVNELRGGCVELCLGGRFIRVYGSGALDECGE